MNARCMSGDSISTREGMLLLPLNSGFGTSSLRSAVVRSSKLSSDMDLLGADGAVSHDFVDLDLFNFSLLSTKIS